MAKSNVKCCKGRSVDGFLSRAVAEAVACDTQKQQ